MEYTKCCSDIPSGSSCLDFTEVSATAEIENFLYPNRVTRRHRVMWGLSTITKEKNRVPWRFGEVNIKFTFSILGHTQISVFLLSLPDGKENSISQQMLVLALSFGCATFRKRGSKSTHRCAEIAI